jgi:hypothetical protein
MMTEGSKPAANDQQSARRQRLAEALRTNLKRRKTQQRARSTAADSEALPKERRSEGD